MIVYGRTYLWPAPLCAQVRPIPDPWCSDDPIPRLPVAWTNPVLYIHTLSDRCRVWKRSSHAATPVLFNSSVHFRDRSLQHHFAPSATKHQKTQRKRNGNNLFSQVVPSPRSKRLRNRGWTFQQRGRSVLNPVEFGGESGEFHPNRRGSQPASLRQNPLPHLSSSVPFLRRFACIKLTYCGKYLVEGQRGPRAR